MAIAWVFPGQGSQKVGMAEALLSIDGSRERFAMASEPVSYTHLTLPTT